MHATKVRGLVARGSFDQISIMQKHSTDAQRIVSLGFKVPFEFRQRFKTHAAREGCTMNELLQRAFDALLARDSATRASDTDREIAK